MAIAEAEHRDEVERDESRSGKERRRADALRTAPDQARSSTSAGPSTLAENIRGSSSMSGVSESGVTIRTGWKHVIATIAAGVVTCIVGLYAVNTLLVDSFAREMSAVSSALERSMDSQNDAFVNQMGAQQASFEGRMNAQQESFVTRMDAMQKSFVGRMDAQTTLMEAQGARLERMERKLDDSL